MDQNATINRKALGRAARLGDLYDAGREEFCGVSLFKSELPSEIISSIDMPNMDLKYDFLDTFEEKFTKLNVQAQLKLSVLAGLCKLEGSGKYLSNEKESYKSVKSSLIYDITTKSENFSISNKNLKELISYDALRMPGATHVVIGIKWGAYVIASFEYENKEDLLKKDIEGVLKTSLEKISWSIEGNGSVELTDNENKLKTNLTIKFFGDIIPQEQELPQTFEKALELMKKVPSYLTKFNNGKGKPLEYILLPLKNVEQFFKMESKIEKKLIDLNGETITRLEQTFDGLLQAKQKFNDFNQEINENNAFIIDTYLDEFRKKNAQIKVTEAEFRSKIARTLLEVRAGKKEPMEIENIIAAFHESPCATADILSFMEKYKRLKNTIKQIAVFKDNNIMYLSKTDSPNVLSMKYREGDIYLLYMNEQLKTENNQLYDDNYRYFLDLVRNKKTPSKFFIVDYDIHPEITINRQISIQFYRNGKLVTDDLYESNKDSLQCCIAKSPLTSFHLNRPVTATRLRIPCAGIKSDCPRDKKEWKCEKCKRFIEYGYDNKFYCSCGGASAESYSFKCDSPLHPDEFLTFTKNDLERYLPDESTKNEINILLLGETGVGKSTFINALLNYLTYSSFEEAETNEILVGIFTQFTLTDDNHIERQIKIGTEDNECTVVGQSSTQYAKAHVFHIGDVTLRIIDTPGIGDTRGLDMDKMNLQNTLSYISYYGHLNGICILLKSNNSRLTLEFRYCIKEVLTNLHRKAAESIVFCFTNSRGTFYKPGDSAPALRSLLKSLEEDSGVSIPFVSNIFCFDNESFRFLAASKQGVQFNDEDKDDFSRSWTRSVKTTEKMMDYISKCPTHKVQETITLNQSRTLIMELSKPIAEISRKIQLNIKLAQDHKKELQENESSINQLKNKLYIPQIDLEPISLDNPRTVCTQSKCTKAVKVDNIIKIDYVTHCHPHCNLKGVVTNSINNSALQQCAAMQNGKCKVCECSWTTHMHITYENKEVSRNVIDENVKKMIDAKTQNHDLVNALVRNCDQLIRELESEQQVIIQISAKFAHFIRNNAIAVFNDDLQHYLEHLIKEEEQKRSCGSQNSSIIQGLKDMKANYIEQQTIFKKAIENNPEHNRVELNEIPTLVNQLYSLKHNGETLKRIVQELKYGRHRVLKFTETQHGIVAKKKNQEDNIIVKGIKSAWNYVTK